MAQKSRDAFRTISEVADWLDVPTHVLRFWESRFSQIKPVKRAGGRRYYRPSDMRIIGGVKVLLHDQGLTIRGVQKLFREEGLKHVSSFAPEIYGAEDETVTIDHQTLEKVAEPAPVATFTRSARPDPVEDAKDAEPVTETAAEETTPDLFFKRAKSADAPPEDQPETPASIDAVVPPASTQDAPEPDPEPLHGPLVPANDVPEYDPDDNEPSYSNGNSIAARLVMTNRQSLDAHRNELKSAFERLKAHLDKAS